MFDTRLRLTLFALLIAAFVALGARATQATTADVPAAPQQPTEEPREGPIPCDPSYSRTIEPRIVKEGENVTISSRYSFLCTGETRKLNYVWVVENSGAMRQGQGGREALDNVTKGARNFINQVDYANGSRGGLMLYASTRTFRVPLIGGEQGRKALIEAFEGISIAPIDNSAGAGAAIRDATGALPTGVQTDFSNVLIIVDAGAQEVPGSDIVDRYTACNAARQSGVTVVVLSFPQAGRRLASCASSGWFFQLSSNTARNMPEVMDKVAEGLLRGLQMDRVLYSDFLEDGFDYVARSGYPRDPDYKVLSEVFWEFGKTAPPSGQVIEYQVKVAEDVFQRGVPRDVSLWSYLDFIYAQGTAVKARMPNPQICVYKDDPAECSQFALTLTPDAAETATPTVPPATPTSQATLAPTETATPTETAGPTETASPTATEETSGVRIFLPIAARGASD